MIYFLKRLTIPEVNKALKRGAVFGEVGIFTPDSIRSASAECIEDCDIFCIDKGKVLELYFQEPKFGFFIVRLLSNYTVDARHHLNNESDFYENKIKLSMPSRLLAR